MLKSPPLIKKMIGGYTIRDNNQVVGVAPTLAAALRMSKRYSAITAGA